MLRLHRSLLRAIRLIPKVLVITFGDVALISSPDLRLLGLIIVPVIAKEKGKVIWRSVDKMTFDGPSGLATFAGGIPNRSVII